MVQPETVIGWHRQGFKFVLALEVPKAESRDGLPFRATSVS